MASDEQKRDLLKRFWPVVHNSPPKPWTVPLAMATMPFVSLTDREEQLFRQDGGQLADSDWCARQTYQARTSREILPETADYLNDAGINALAGTNEELHDFLNPYLYRRDMARSSCMSLEWGARNGVEATGGR
jgi:hypothetical protein